VTGIKGLQPNDQSAGLLVKLYGLKRTWS